MQELLNLIKTNHFVRIALGTTIGISLLIIIFSSSTAPPHQPSQTNLSSLITTNPTNTQLKYTQPNNDDLSSFSPTELTTARSYRNNIAGILPLHKNNFTTSVNIKTDINIYINNNDPIETTRFEISGLSYTNSETNPDINPNITAYRESFNHGLQLLKDNEIVPNRMIFSYSDTNQIQNTAKTWINHLKLLN